MTMAFDPVSFAKTAKEAGLVLSAKTDRERAKIPKQLEDLQLMAGTYGLSLKKDHVSLKYDKVMGHIVWNYLLDDSAKSLCGEISGKRMPTWTSLVEILRFSTSLERPFRGFAKMLSDSPWRGRGATRLTTANVGLLHKEVQDLEDTYIAMVSNLYARVGSFINTTLTASDNSRLDVRVRDGRLSAAKAGKLRSKRFN